MIHTSHKDARNAGWFSRRHRSDDAHRAAREQWRERRAAKLARAARDDDERDDGGS